MKGITVKPVLNDHPLLTVPLKCKLTVFFESQFSKLDSHGNQVSRIEYGESSRESSLTRIKKIMSLSLEWLLDRINQTKESQFGSI